ncbi:MAG: oxidoreductase [Planctomycetes bacterium]|nr:oxidoreductase [Planctomycetota bacterium]
MCGVALVPTVRILCAGTSESVRLTWDLFHGAFCIGIDPLSAFFLLPILGLSALAAIYGGNYLLAYRDKKSLGSTWFFFNLFVAGMISVVIARTAFLFLVAWEVMSLSAYFLVTFEHEKAEVRRAGWIYLVATHLGVAFIFAAFVLLGRRAGSLEFDVIQDMPATDSVTAGVVFVLATIGFGAKAGFVPFHVWLPEAHPAAPSHVSALMSGVMIKMGIYGLVRIVTFMGPPAPWWGLTLGALGLLTALVGISLALHQRDMKRVLAYSSIENMGLIGLALGIGLWGWANRLPTVAVLGMTAALLHVWNHGLMKCLMFFAAGSVLHGTGTADMEKQGGLMKRMPWTASALIVGAVAIASLPPLNGFVSKWLIYSSLLRCNSSSTGASGLAPLLTIGLLALIGGLAAIAFVRLTGVVLLGSPRSKAAELAHESSAWMLGPMAILAGLCVTAALIPRVVTGQMRHVLDQVLGTEASRSLLRLETSDTPLQIVGVINAWTIVAFVAATFLLIARSRKPTRKDAPTWGCGYVKPTVRMQYTGRSFAETISEHLLPRFLRPRIGGQLPRGLFPAESRFTAECPDPVSDRVYEPFFGRWAERFARLRVLQQGKIHVYLVYIVVVVVLALAWVSIRGLWGTA